MSDKSDPKLLRKFEGCSFENIMKRALLIDRRTAILKQHRPVRETKGEKQ